MARDGEIIKTIHIKGDEKKTENTRSSVDLRVTTEYDYNLLKNKLGF